MRARWRCRYRVAQMRGDTDVIRRWQAGFEPEASPQTALVRTSVLLPTPDTHILPALNLRSAAIWWDAGLPASSPEASLTLLVLQT